jgi:hypothetical protein
VGDSLTLNQCTLSGNSATYGYGGGGIYNFGVPLTLNQCTLFGNETITFSTAPSGPGGGIYNIGGLLILNQCTLFGNGANSGGGVINNSFVGGGVLAMTNTIVAGNSALYGADIYNSYNCTLTYGGSNLVQSVANSGGTITGPAPLTDAPNLAPLGNYGGPTQTMPPLPGSPAIGAGSVAYNIFATDQRDYPRTQNGLIDLGAVELQPPAANPPVLTSPSLAANGAVAFGFTNASNADFTVLATTNLTLPLGQWSILGQAVQNAPGQYQFTDTAATNHARQFYRVVSP